MNGSTKRTLEAFQPPTCIKLALLWATLMFLFIYNDYFSLYLPGTITSMSAGRMGPLGAARPGILVAVSILLAIPALMIFLSAALPPFASRWLNVLFGSAYTLIQALTFSGSEPFYKIVVVLELMVTVLIVWYALRWPRKSQPVD